MKKILLTVLIILLIVLPIGTVIYDCYHPTYWKYNDDFVKKSNLDEIQEKYGAFDYYKKEGSFEYCGYKSQTDKQTTDGRRYDVYYYIIFREGCCDWVYKHAIFEEMEN